MTAKKKKALNHVEMLDNLVQKYYDRLSQDVEKIARIGDMLKMIELRQKLTPTGSGQKAFWEMMDKIRRDSLSKQQTKTKTPSRKKTGGKKEQQKP